MLRKIVTIGVMQIAGRLASVLTSIILARELSPHGFGMYAIIIALIAVSTIPLGQAFSPILIREIAGNYKKNNKNIGRILEFLRRYKIITTVLGALFIVLALNDREKFSELDVRVLIVIAVLIMIIKSLSIIRASILKGYGFVKEAQYPETLISPLIMLIGVLVLATSRNVTLESVLLVILLSYVVANFAGNYLLKRKKALDDVVLHRDWSVKTYAKQIIYFLILAVSHNSSEQIMILISAAYLDPSEIAGLKLAISLGALLSIGLMIANQILSPEIAKLNAEGNVSEIAARSKQIAKLSFLLSAPIIVAVFLWAEVLIEITYGTEYVDIASVAVRLVLLGQLINIAFGSVGTTLNMMGDEKLTIAGHLTGSVTKVVLIYLLIESHGINGVAFSYVVGILIWNVVLTIILRKKYKMNVSVL